MQNKNVKHLHELKQLIGCRQFHKIVTNMPGAAIRIPSDPEYFDKEDRNERIRKDFYSGMDIQDLATKYRLSESHIRKITEGK